MTMDDLLQLKNSHITFTHHSAYIDHMRIKKKKHQQINLASAWNYWQAVLDSNQRPQASEACTLSNWANRPCGFQLVFTFRLCRTTHEKSPHPGTYTRFHQQSRERMSQRGDKYYFLRSLSSTTRWRARICSGIKTENFLQSTTVFKSDWGWVNKSAKNIYCERSQNEIL